ncbi:MAG: glycosyltransferase [Planctomycetota bacterium]
MPSQIWIRRQLVGFDRVTPTVLCWETHSAADEWRQGFELIQLTTPFVFDRGKSRWLHRARHLLDGNHYAAPAREAKLIRQHLERTKPKAILCHFGYSALRVLPEASRLSIPVIAHFHGLDLSSGLRNRWYRDSLLKYLDRFAQIVTVGSHQKTWILEQGIAPEKVHLIPCGVPVAEFTPPPETLEEKTNTESFAFVLTSRLVDWKGVDYSLKAFAEVAERHAAVRLHIIGDGEETENLKALANELNVADRVVFHGSQPPEFVHEQMRRSHAFLQHSLDHHTGWNEGFGVSITEASSTELPVVVTRCGGIPDQVVDGETGFIVPQRDVSAMAAAMGRLVEDRALARRLGVTGRKHVSEHFDTADQVRKLERVVLEAIGD